MDLLTGKSTIERKLMMQAKKQLVPINGSIELLPLCNMNCDMCYVRMSGEEILKLGGRLRTSDEWLKIAAEMKNSGTLFLLLTGGEPLMYPEFKKVYLGCRKLGMILTVNTNATLLDEEWADFFAEYKPRRINITLYGSSDETYRKLCHYPGGYEKAVNAIKLLKERNVDVRVGMSVAKDNAADTFEILDFCKKIGVSFNVDTYLMPASRERLKPFDQQSRNLPEDAAEIYFRSTAGYTQPSVYLDFARNVLSVIDHYIPMPEPNRHFGCLAGSCSFSINWQGYMRQCVIVSDQKYPVFEKGFMNCWKELTEDTGKILSSLKCAQCPRKILCRTCAIAALFEEGKYDAVPDYLCRYTAHFELLIRKWYEEYRKNGEEDGYKQEL